MIKLNKIKFVEADRRRVKIKKIKNKKNPILEGQIYQIPKVHIEDDLSWKMWLDYKKYSQTEVYTNYRLFKTSEHWFLLTNEQFKT